MRFYAYYVSVVSRPKHHVLARLSEAKLAEDKHAPPLLYSSSYKVFGQPSSLIVTLAINFKLTSLLRALAQIRYRLLAQASSPIHAHNTQGILLGYLGTHHHHDHQTSRENFPEGIGGES